MLDFLSGGGLPGSVAAFKSHTGLVVLALDTAGQKLVARIETRRIDALGSMYSLQVKLFFSSFSSFKPINLTYIFSRTYSPNLFTLLFTVGYEKWTLVEETRLSF